MNREAGEHKSAAYLKLNPNGLIPVLIDDGEPLYETAAILMHLADKTLAFAPPLGNMACAHYLKWMVWMTNTLQAMLIHYFPERMVRGRCRGSGRRQVAGRGPGGPHA